VKHGWMCLRSRWPERCPKACHRNSYPWARNFRVPAPRPPSQLFRRARIALHLPVPPPRLAFRRPEGLSRSVLSCAADLRSASRVTICRWSETSKTAVRTQKPFSSRLPHSGPGKSAIKARGIQHGGLAWFVSL
jgi:hypothetical protein